jgi:hypothetical protein
MLGFEIVTGTPTVTSKYSQESAIDIKRANTSIFRKSGMQNVFIDTKTYS